MISHHSRSNLEHRTFIPNNRSSSNASNTSRMQQDLSASPHQASPLGDEGSMQGTVVRRAVGKAPHVCVIGAGVAGLRCADVLLQHGIKVTILEGRDRVGGRVSLTAIHDRNQLAGLNSEQVCQSNNLGHLVDL